MIRILKLAAAFLVGMCMAAHAQTVSPTTPLGNAVQTFGGLQMAVAPGSLGTPGGTMSGYATGDQYVLACPGVTFTYSPVIGISAVSTGSATSAEILQAGQTTGAVPSGSVTCTQASAISGSGTGMTISVQFGLIASYLSIPSLTTGGTSGAANGNLIINQGPLDMNANTNAGAGSENTFLGNKAGFGFTGFSYFNTCVGHNACGNGNVTPATGTQTTVVGNDAARNMSSSALGPNAIFGRQAAVNLNSNHNAIFGSLAANDGGGSTALTGGHLALFGDNVGQAMTSAANIVCVGSTSCSGITSGANDIIIAGQAGTDNCVTTNVSNEIAFCGGSTPNILVTGAGTPTTATITLHGSTVVIPDISNATGAQTGTLCWASGGITYDNTNTCLASDADLKMQMAMLDRGLDDVMKLKPITFEYKDQATNPGEHVGFTAQDVAKVDPRFAETNADGKPIKVRYIEMVALLTKAMQEQQHEIDALKGRRWCFAGYCL